MCQLYFIHLSLCVSCTSFTCLYVSVVFHSLVFMGQLSCVHLSLCVTSTCYHICICSCRRACDTYTIISFYCCFSHFLRLLNAFIILEMCTVSTKAWLLHQVSVSPRTFRSPNPSHLSLWRGNRRDSRGAPFV